MIIRHIDPDVGNRGDRRNVGFNSIFAQLTALEGPSAVCYSFFSRAVYILSSSYPHCFITEY
jgi:hypothetical protein